MWVVAGKWRREKLALILPDQSEAILAGQPVDFSRLPALLPTNVNMTLGRDEAFPLFPYRIEFRRQNDAQAGRGRRC